MRAFIGVILAMGLIQIKGKARGYWSQRCPLIRLEGIAEVFPRDRFHNILRYLHFVDESRAPLRTVPDPDSFYKVRLLLDALLPKFRSLYSPSRELCVDESIIKTKDHFRSRDVVRNKPVKLGLKACVLCEAKTGYILNLTLAGGGEQPKKGLKNSSVVQNICRPYHGMGYQLFMDHSYTSFELLKKLGALSWTACGAVSPNHGAPTVFMKKNSQDLCALKRGDAMFQCRDGVVACAWRDAKLVTVLSTLPVGTEMTHVNRTPRAAHKYQRGATVNCPVVVAEYNRFMGRVDLVDQRISAYRRHMKGLLWPHKVFWYFLDIAVINCYLLYVASLSQGRAKLKPREFREKLAVELVGGNSFCKRLPPRLPSEELRFNRQLEHAPQRVATASRCAVHLQRCETIYACRACGVRMCPDPCFYLFHFKADYVYDD
uniref:Tyrosinase copper-binding domain-containing protein n=2 Tax=Latimeria chalumnae TaxID=7897 RepID=M3XK74_LATCH